MNFISLYPAKCSVLDFIKLIVFVEIGAPKAKNWVVRLLLRFEIKKC
jgi:hypothetical protein